MTDAPRSADALLAEAAEEARIIPFRTVGTVGDADGKLTDDFDVGIGGNVIHGLIQIVRRRVIALGGPFLSDGCFWRVHLTSALLDSPSPSAGRLSLIHISEPT